MVNELLFFVGINSIIHRMARGLVAIVMVMSSGLVFASDLREWSIDLNGLSQHSERRYVENGVSREYNEINRGLGATIEWLGWGDFVRRSKRTDWIEKAGIDADIKFGFFENSYRKTSFYGGPFFHKDLSDGDWKFAPGIALLLTTGYKNTPEDAPVVFPIPVFGVEIGHRAIKLNFGYVPWGKVDFATVQLQFVPAYW